MESSLSSSLRTFHARLRTCLVTEQEFGAEISKFLTDLGRCGLCLKVTVKENETVFAEFGAPGNGNPCKSKSSNESPVTILFSGWSSTGSTTQEIAHAEVTWDDIIEDISRIFSEHWRCRQTPSALWTGSDSSVAAKRQETVRLAAAQGKPIAYVRLDCDGVGEMKRTLGGEEKPTEVMRAVSRFFQQQLAQHCLTFHLHGDEFALIFIGCSRRNVLERLVRFQTDFCDQDFRPSGHTEAIHLAVKMAVAFGYENRGRVGAETAYNDILAEAEKVEFKNREDRGFIEIAEANNPVVGSITNQAILESVLWARQGLATVQTSIFRDSLHDLITDNLIQHSDDSSLSDYLKILERQFVLRIYLASEQFAHLSTSKISASRHIPLSRLVAMMLHVILKRRFLGFGPALDTGKLRVIISKTIADKPQTLSIQQLHETEWITHFTYGPIPTCQSIEMEAGEPWLQHDADPDGTKQLLTRWIPKHPIVSSLSPCLAVLAGAAAMKLEPSVCLWAVAIVRIDDRPVVSGHLPDFWQRNLARIVVECLRNPNIRNILLLRENPETVKETVQYLKGACIQFSLGASPPELPQSWETEQIGLISLATTIKHTQLVHFCDRKIRLKVIDAKEDIMLETAQGCFNADIQHLRAVGDPDPIIWRSEKPSDEPWPKVEFRHSKLSEAYPHVMRALRHQRCSHYVETNGEELAELTCVHVHLENPSVDDLPEYWARAVEQFDRYYQRAFTPDSLFGQRFYHWGGNGAQGGTDQFDKAIQQTVDAIEKKRLTRRIILATPEPPGTTSSDPLGLTSVHVFPRFRGETWFIDFIWVWRSVEAIVGFPFSAHGSVKFSSDFVNKVKLRIIDVEPSVRLGELTYIAISMHLFCDPADLSIARHIDLEARP